MARGWKKLTFLAVIAVGGYAAYTHFSIPGELAPAAGAEGMPPAPPVSAAIVVERDIQQWREYSGRLAAVDKVEIRPRVAGAITAVHFKNGAQVKQGDALFTIDPRPYEAAYKAAEARATYAQTEYKRAERLRKDNAVPQQEFEQRKNEAAVAEAELTTAKLNLEYTKVLAPISGKVGRAEVTVGNLVGQGQPVMTTLVSTDPIYADFEVDESTYLHYAKTAGQQDASAPIPVKMGLATEEGTAHEGVIDSFDNQLNIASGTIRARAVFENKDGTLLPGLFARIHLGSAGTEHALLITDRAVGTDQNRKFVLVVKPDNSTEHREVTLGDMADGLRVVTSGLNPGEKIIVSGLQRVMMPGMPVAAEIVPMDAPEPVIGNQGSEKPEPEKPATEDKSAEVPMPEMPAEKTSDN